MASNVNITPGTGDVVAAEDIGSVKYQQIKLIDGSATSTAATGVAANPLVVSLNTTAVTISNVPHAVVDSGNINISSATLGTVTVVGNVNVATATLGTVTVSGNVNVASATLGTVTVSLSSTKVTIDNTPLNVNVATATLGTVTVSGTVSLSSTAVTISNGGSINVNVATATLGTVTVSLSSTKVTIDNTPLNVNVATATLGTVTISGNVNVASATLGTVTVSVSNSVSTIPILSRTYTGGSGTISTSGNNTIFPAGTNKTKVYGFSLTTTATTPTLCIFQSGAGGNELWRVLLQAPSGANSGANLAVAPPAFLFATASATLLNLNLSAANAVHYSFSCFDEA